MIKNNIYPELFPENIETLAKKTPFFVFSKKKIQDKYNKYKKLFSGAEICYAMKANSEPEILNLLNESNSSFEVASVYELDLLKTLKTPPQKIIYGTAIKQIDHIKAFVDYGVDRFAFDTFGELEKIASIAPKARVYARVSVNDSGSVFKFSEKFGTNVDNLIPLMERARDLNLIPYGISFHVGSQASNLHAWANAIKEIRTKLEQLQKLGIEVQALNLGGGFPCHYTTTGMELLLDDIYITIEQVLESLPYKLHIILEPGRGIIGDTGLALATVVARVERKDATWLFLDLGVYNGLYEAMAFQGSTRYPITNITKINTRGSEVFALAGPTGDSADIITREALLPHNTETGDKLIFHNTGAYSLVTACPFNGFPKPPVYYV